MALIKCAECGKDISDKAETCPHCGFKAGTAKVQKKKSGNGLLYFILTLGSLVIITTISGKSTPREYVVGKDTVGAVVFCENIVENSLKSPSTAKFPNAYSGKIQHIGDDIYTLRSYVDSQNSFGAIVRTNFMCKAQRSGSGSWSLLDITNTK